MLSSDRRSVLIFLALAGCGFAPALQSGGAAQGVMGQVRPADPVDDAGYDFVKHLEQRLGRADAPTYALTYAISTEAEGVGITAARAITRYNLTGQVDWTLTRQSDGVRMTGGTVGSFTGYSATGSAVAGLTARADAERRLMVILADQIVAEVLATAANWQT